jgi:parallel beta-helix repeat protein
MKLLGVRFALISLVAGSLLSSVAHAMTLQLGSGGAQFVSVGDTWKFFRGRSPASTPPEAWTDPNFDDSAWEAGPSGFGFSDNDDATVLDDMQGQYVTVYIRKEFTVASPIPAGALELTIDYDDGFIAYLNGREVARRGMPAGPATYETLASASHEAGTPETISLGRAADWLRAGKNVLAIEGHNNGLTSSDLSLIPALRVGSDTLKNGDTYILTTVTAGLHGQTLAEGVASVLVMGAVADFHPADGTWRADVNLAPGLNTIAAQALNADGNEVDSGTVEIVYVPPANHLAGELTEDTVLSGAYIVDQTVTVPDANVLTIEPGTVLLLQKGVALVVAGQLLAEGTAEEPIRFTHLGDGTTWKQLMFLQAADSRLIHCIFEYTDSVGEHQDYYVPGPRVYHEGLVALACHLDINDCTFQKMPGDGPHNEGDALAIISDDEDLPGEASANILRCQFLGIGQGVHTRYAHVRVEDCYFQGKYGDNDDVDLWGESTPPCIIRNNIFDLPEYDDRINPTRCSCIIEGNIIMGSNDHGMVLRDKSSPLVVNNVIIGCSSGGIAVENSCTATLINNTIINCGRGVRLFDLGRWGPPYSLNPGGGTATITNCIIWDCSQPITLADTSNTGIADRGSHVTVSYCDIQGGRQSISVSGSHSTITWGEGNISADPLFTDMDKGDLHLLPGSPAIDTANTAEAPQTDCDGQPRPVGPAADMGAYEYTPDPNS